MIEVETVIRMSGNSVVVIIPMDVWKDSANKFRLNQKVKLHIGNKIVISPLPASAKPPKNQ
jgi:antitoxin component of MazEF toxin-antitoxin module